MRDSSATGASPSRYAAESQAALAVIPGRVLARSTDAGWTSVLLELREKSARVGETTAHESLPTPDPGIVLTVDGDLELECFGGGVWRRVVRQPGSAGLTAGGQVDRLRWRLRDPTPVRTAHLYVPAALVHEAEEEFRRAGSRRHEGTLSSLGFRDSAVAHAILALLDATRAGAPDLYAESVAQFLATHLLSPHAAWLDGTEDRRSPAPLTDRRLARAREYLSAHFREPVSLDDVAAEAGVSKFHFVRLFRAATGQAPHAYLVRLRLQCARRLLRDSELTVAEVAASCGYASAAHFGRAFARETGQTPTAYRAARRGGGVS